MSRRLRRLSYALAPALLLGSLTACGDSGDSGDSSALDSVTIEGSAGTEPDVTFKDQMDVSSVDTTTLEKGDGAEIESGDQVIANFWIGDGYTQKKAFSTYDSGSPQVIPISDSTNPVFADALEGQTVGSRVAVTAQGDDLFGDTGNPDLGIGNKDGVLLLLDVVGTILDAPEGTEQKAPAWAPDVETKQDAVTGLDFKGTPKPTGALRSAVLVQGEGPTVKKGQTIYVDYLGQVYGGDKPFDESYSKGQPASFKIGVGAVVKGWDQTLVGQKVGSRVILAIPPKLGYGEQGSPQAGISGTDTLYFVVDVLGAA